MGASSLLGGPNLSSPAGALPAQNSQDFAGMNSLTDPMAAVYANVNQNLSPTGASLLTPWGMQPGQQVHAPENHQPTSPTATSDIGNYPISKCCFPSMCHLRMGTYKVKSTAVASCYHSFIA